MTANKFRNDPFLAVLLKAAGHIPAAKNSLRALGSGAACDTSLRRRIWRLERTLSASQLLNADELEELGDILRTVERWVDAGTYRGWISDEHCVSGGWFETVWSPEAEALAGHCARLQACREAMEQVQVVIEAHKIAGILRGAA
ncbi:hypothetical protein [Ruegeria intermedia]|uniref:hypothetical protein n=1 Tax=Ruegeria intermedia TaxID=996115 RepID=UPI00122CDE04|nr:hypothetical protein [Ruegeria intermedia]